MLCSFPTWFTPCLHCGLLRCSALVPKAEVLSPPAPPPTASDDGRAKHSRLWPPSLAASGRQLSDWPHLDAAHASRRYFRGDLDGVVQVPGVNQIEPGQLLIGLGVRAVTDGHFAVANPHGGGGLNRLKGLRGKALTAVPERLIVGHAFVVGHGSDLLLFAVHKA